MAICAVVVACVAGAVHGMSPVLVLSEDGGANPFGNYLPEIFRGEGLLAFDQLARADWNSATNPTELLGGYRAVVMPEMSLTAAEQQALRNYVQSGGTLIGARPDAGLADVYGIEFAGNRPERLQQYFGVDAEQRPGRGITQGALQYHGVAANYTLQGATGLAYLYANPNTASANPAVTTHAYGQGRAVAFAFDPSKSVVLTRQGNPSWQNTEGDGVSQYRPHDFFVRTDGRSMYDPERLAIPHADELQRLMANVLQEAIAAPLPRMWYLPGTHKSLMVNTGDGEDNYGSQFDAILNDAASYGSKFTVYLRDIGVANTTVAKEAQWRAAGHEVGVHMYADGAEGAGAVPQMTFAYDRVTSAVESKFGHAVRTARSHTIDWTGWVDMARIEEAHGTLLDTNYYHYLNGNVVDPLTANGYFTGSGLPQRFIDEQGTLLGIYQAATQWPDEWFADNGMSAQQAVDVMKTMFESAEAKGYYSAFVNNVHPVRYYGSDITSDWARAIWAYCRDEDIPMWSAEMLLDFVQARDGTQFTELVHTAHTLEFDYTAGGSAVDLTVMIPMAWEEQRLATLSIDGQPRAWSVEDIKGVEYAMVTPGVSAGRIVAEYALPSAADFDGDGDVDAADLAAWGISFGEKVDADADRDGDSDGADFLMWQRQLATQQAVTPVSQVPEPGSLAIVISLAVAGSRVRRCRLSRL